MRKPTKGEYWLGSDDEIYEITQTEHSAMLATEGPEGVKNFWKSSLLNVLRNKGRIELLNLISKEDNPEYFI